MGIADDIRRYQASITGRSAGGAYSHGPIQSYDRPISVSRRIALQQALSAGDRPWERTVVDQWGRSTTYVPYGFRPSQSDWVNWRQPGYVSGPVGVPPEPPVMVPPVDEGGRKLAGADAKGAAFASETPELPTSIPGKSVPYFALAIVAVALLLRK